jgi:acyl-CoA dehydrogenase
MALAGELSDAGVEMLSSATRIGIDVAGATADAVDSGARFPTESIDAMRQAGLLGALIPAEYGGLGCTYTDLSVVCTELGKYCSSSAMVFAMHQIQVACIVEHCRGLRYFDDLMVEIAASGRLIASATTEAGIGGDVRSSLCAVEYDGEKIRIEKNASVISYGEYVDDVLVTARVTADAAASDQVIVHVSRPNLTLDPSGDWDTIGMRGTSSIGFLLQATGTVEQIVPTTYAEVAARTMLPVSHITWASLWLGIAENAVQKARVFVRSAARKNPGTLPPSALHLAETFGGLEKIRALVEIAVHEYERVRPDADQATSMSFAIRMNNLKLSVSQDVLTVVQQCLFICGIAGFRNDTPYSLGRQLRDANSARLMVHNDRILDHNASLLCVMKD